MINCEMGSENNIVERIRPIGCVKEVSGVFGNYDVIVKIQSRHIDEIRKTIVEDIRKLEGYAALPHSCAQIGQGTVLGDHLSADEHG